MCPYLFAMRTVVLALQPMIVATNENGTPASSQLRALAASNAVLATINAGVEGAGGDIATGAGWVRAGKVLLTIVSPDTNRVVERLGPPAGSGAVRVAGKFVWVTAHGIQTIWVLPTPATQ